MRKNLCHVFFPEGHELSFAVSCEESNRIRETEANTTAITG